MKVYVVTSGSYSDYSIKKIFLDKEKAERYIDIKEKEGCLDINGLEIYETSDDNLIELKKYIYVQFIIYSNGETQYIFEIINTNTLDNPCIDDYPYIYSYYHYIDWCNEYIINIHRPLTQENYDEEKLYNKYKKVCEDIWAMIKYNLSEGWDEKMINKWLKEQTI
jgi:hypothetical protein